MTAPIEDHADVDVWLDAFGPRSLLARALIETARSCCWSPAFGSPGRRRADRGEV